MTTPIESAKSSEIDFRLLYPGSEGSGLIVPGATPVTIFLAPELVVAQEQPMYPGLTYTSSPNLVSNFGADALHAARARALMDTGDRTTALFFERVLQVVFEEPLIDLQHIKVGVMSFTGESYHEYGYLLGRQDYLTATGG